MTYSQTIAEFVVPMSLGVTIILMAVKLYYDRKKIKRLQNRGGGGGGGCGGD